MSPSPQEEPIRLLIIDDDEVDRSLVRRYLVAAGVAATIDEAGDARDVVPRSAGDVYDCIVLDHLLPGETAFEVVARLRQADIWTPILVVASQDEEVGAAIVAAGASDFLSKIDLSPSRLARRLRYVLRLGRAERQARRVRDELDAQRQLLGAVIAQLPTGVVVVDPAISQVLVSNQRAEEIVGADGVKLLSAEPPAPVQQAREALATALATGVSATLDGTFAYAGRELRVSAAPVIAAEQVVAGMIVFDDVSDQVEARRGAERAAHAREDVLAIVSHDLRGPLSAISVALDGLRDVALEGNARHRYIGAIQRSVDRADRLIRDLMTAHQIEVGRLQVEPRPVGVRSLLEHAVREHELLATQARSQLVIQIEDGVDKIFADRDRIAQALANLIGNALRHARGTATIELVARPGEAGAVMLGVRDHGPGVAEDALPHVFDRYWQGRQRRGGAGLGLAIVRGIARAHGGEALVSHVPGGGALFMLSLPPAPPPQ